MIKEFTAISTALLEYWGKVAQELDYLRQVVVIFGEDLTL
jgi:hypothetical protein